MVTYRFNNNNGFPVLNVQVANKAVGRLVFCSTGVWKYGSMVFGSTAAFKAWFNASN